MSIGNCVRFGMRHLYNRKILFLLSVIMVMVSAVLLFNVFSVYYFWNEEVLNGRVMFGNGREYLYKIDQKGISNDGSCYEKFHECTAELREQMNIALYHEDNMDISGLNKDELAPILKEIRDESHQWGLSFSKEFNIDNSLLQACGIKDEEGNLVQLGTQEKYTEVAVGKNYERFLPVGTVFRDNLRGQEFIVTCVLKEGQIWRSGDLYGANGFVSLDNYLILPMNFEEYYDATSYYGNIYYIDEKGTAEEDIAKIEKAAGEHEVYLEVQSLKKYEASYLEENRSYHLFSRLLAILMIGTSVTAVAVISLSSWLLDSHDIGVMCVGGFQYGDLLKIILSENIIRLLIPSGISYFLIYRMNLTGGLRKVVCDKTLGAIYMIFFVCFILVSLFCYAVIRAKSPNDLLKGEGA